ncbi:hypothetical protein [Streptomyces sp. NPDC055992]|uniref:hypothetical protein n=1 Tax=Streptomyces sp. NPDC055992 TaxID=3345673 RepID=UPI0035D87933
MAPWMIGVDWLELCQPVTPAALQPCSPRVYRTGDAGRDPGALPQLFEVGETESMHAHGWSRVPQPETSTGQLAHVSLVPRDRGAG